MKFFRLALVALLLGWFAPLASAATDRISTHFSADTVEAPDFEVAAETAYMLGIIGNPNSYEVAAQFFTARWRWGGIERDSWLQGYNQFYALFMVEPIMRGPEKFYYGISVGLRYNFAKPGARFVPYVSGGVGLGWIDSHCEYIWRPGPGLHLQHSDGDRRLLPGERSFEAQRGNPLPASFQRRTNRSEPEPEPSWSANRRDLFFLMAAPDENVLVIRRSLFDELGSFHGLNFEPEKYLSAIALARK